MNIDRLILIDEPNLFTIKKIINISKNINKIIESDLSKLKKIISIYRLKKMLLKTIVINKFVSILDLRKIEKCLKKLNLINEQTVSVASDDSLDNIISFFVPRLKKTPIEIEKGFRQKDIILSYNAIIEEQIERLIAQALIKYDPKEFQKMIEKLKNRIKKNVSTTNKEISKIIKTENPYNISSIRNNSNLSYPVFN